MVFNRSDHALQALKAIREYSPEKLYIGADGPRASKLGEIEACEKVRNDILNAIDWNCEVHTLFRETNLGCAHAVNSAISWFFENEEYGCIIEDDVVVSLDFFSLCEDLLPRYASNERIMEISAQNRSGRTDISNSYVFSQCYHCWGWASWRRAWERMDMSMSYATQISIFWLIKRLGLIRGLMMYRYFMSGYSNLGTFGSWATRWYLSILKYDGLVLVPGVNLSINIGTDGGAHYNDGDKDPFAKLRIGRIVLPLKYNDDIKIDKKQTIFDSKEFVKVRWIGLKKLITNKIQKK